MTDDIERLLDEVRLLYHRIVQVAEQLHAGEPVTLGMRAVLELLLKNGPTTVPDVARSRNVTRQHIQSLVNPLFDEGFVALKDNPAHKRSSLVKLTDKGERAIRRMRRREARLYESTDFAVSLSELRATARSLKRVREALKGDR